VRLGDRGANAWGVRHDGVPASRAQLEDAWRGRDRRPHDDPDDMAAAPSGSARASHAGDGSHRCDRLLTRSALAPTPRIFGF
jgi:hypothetical protein